MRWLKHWRWKRWLRLLERQEAVAYRSWRRQMRVVEDVTVIYGQDLDGYKAGGPIESAQHGCTQLYGLFKEARRERARWEEGA